MNDATQSLITNLGVLAVAALPILALAFKWSQEKQDTIAKMIGPLVAAVALVAGSLFALSNARNHAETVQAHKIEAVKAAAAHPADQRPMLMRSMGVKPE